MADLTLFLKKRKVHVPCVYSALYPAYLGVKTGGFHAFMHPFMHPVLTASRPPSLKLRRDMLFP